MIRKDKAAGAHSAQQELDELRQLLFEREHVRLERIERSLDEDRVAPEALSKVLPKALMLAQDDKALNYALAKPVESALQQSVRKNPAPLAEAIYPAIGPAIRKAVSTAISSMMQGFNAALENSFSPRSLMWRFDAWRTGKKFSEVALLKTLVFRVEQVFLIHRKSGLLLRHLVAPTVEANDADMVSAMLTAIQDFARDSFNASAHDTVRTMKVGEVNVWVEQGPHALLAVTVRGTPPGELRGVMQRALERCHADMASELAEFAGAAEPFATVEPHLETCLLQARTVKNNDVRNTVLFFLALAAVIGLAYWFVNSTLQERRWNRFLTAVRTEPGLVVTEYGERDGKYFIEGLRDPLATDPSALLKKLEADRVDQTWRTYHALDGDLLLKRARLVLAPPTGVKLSLVDGALAAKGSASRAWLDRAPLLAAAMGTTLQLNVEDLDVRRLDAARALVADYKGGVAGLGNLARTVRNAFDHAHALGVRAYVSVTGLGAADARMRLLAAGSFDGTEIRVGKSTDGPLQFRIIERAR